MSQRLPHRPMRATALAAALFSLPAAGPALTHASAGTAGRAAHNITANPSFTSACAASHGRGRECMKLTLLAIERARSMESMRQYALVLPDDFRSLTPAEQTFVVINLERVDRGLRPIEGLVAGLNQDAQNAAYEQADPDPSSSQLRAAGVRRYRTLWSRGYGVLASDYAWMYDDGYGARGSSNMDCRTPRDPGCWAHRRAILSPFGGYSRLLAGAGSAYAAGGTESVAAILTAGYGGAGRFTYTWREALIHGADGRFRHR